ARGEMAERNSCRQDAQAAGCVPPSFEEYRYGSIDVSGTSAPELSSWDNGAALACFFGMVPKVAERKLPTLLWSHRARDETASPPVQRVADLPRLPWFAVFVWELTSGTRLKYACKGNVRPTIPWATDCRGTGHGDSSGLCLRQENG